MRNIALLQNEKKINSTSSSRDLSVKTNKQTLPLYYISIDYDIAMFGRYFMKQAQIDFKTDSLQNTKQKLNASNAFN